MLHAVRDPYFAEVYRAVEDSIAAQGPLKGSLFWQWNFPGDVRNDRGVFTTDTTYG